MSERGTTKPGESGPGTGPSPGPGPDQPAIRVTLMPKDTNAYGTIFGGIILSYIDQAGAIEAHRHSTGRLVTVAMREVEFHAPVFVGDLVSFFTETVKIGTTSLTTRVTVEAARAMGRDRVKVTEAEVVYVQVDDQGNPTPIVPVGGGPPVPPADTEAEPEG